MPLMTSLRAWMAEVNALIGTTGTGRSADSSARWRTIGASLSTFGASSLPRASSSSSVPCSVLRTLWTCVPGISLPLARRIDGGFCPGISCGTSTICPVRAITIGRPCGPSSIARKNMLIGRPGELGMKLRRPLLSSGLTV